MGSLLNGFISYYSKLGQIGLELLGKVKDGISSGIGSMLDVGKNLVKGLWNGIKDTKDWLFDKIKGFKDAVLNKFKSFFGIHSPSKLFEKEIGVYLAKGLGVGFTNEMISVNKEIQKSLPTDFDLGVSTTVNRSFIDKATSNQLSNDSIANIIDNAIDKKLSSNSANDFNLTINNNSKYTSPAENARLIRRELQMYKLRNS